MKPLPPPSSAPIPPASPCPRWRTGSAFFGCLLLLTLLFPPVIQGATVAPESAPPVVDWFAMWSGLLGGIALFLFGMDRMAKSLQSVAGSSMKFLLGKLTQNSLLGALTGAFVTAILNSSTITTVLLVGFISAGLLTLQQSIGVIMGANIGSTFTAQIIAFNVSRYAPLIIAAGFLWESTSRHEHRRIQGTLVMGLGLIFFGMGLMGGAMAPLRDYTPFVEWMVRMEHPTAGILTGAVFTALIHSSATTTGIAIVMASEGLITLPAGIALALGANIGTCVTAVIASVGKPVDARRASVAHVLFNVFGVLIWAGLIPQLADIVTRISPQYPDLTGTARLAAEVPRQIANAHTAFNVLNTLLFIGFAGPIARWIQRLVPDSPDARHAIITPQYLDPELIRTPGLALEHARLELVRMGKIAQNMVDRLKDTLTEGHIQALRQTARIDDQIDLLEGAILDYLQRIGHQSLTDDLSHQFLVLMSTADHWEAIGDVVENQLVPTGIRIAEERISISRAMKETLNEMLAQTSSGMTHAIQALATGDENAARTVFSLKPDIDRLALKIQAHQAHKLTPQESNRLTIFRLEMEMVSGLKNINAHIRRIARLHLPEELQGSTNIQHP
ncbi:MAG: Na/Pi cotransporter family protein [Verrucomicrobiota bacterium]|nr:Na/Pi cotransporter family protein [Verrucomicrobiota bacterium]MDD8050952.1 Na/Pi cotransporter family protein [Verrucomicrobiota bacterium]